MTRLLRRMLRAFAAIAMLGCLALVALLAFLWLEHESEVTLPVPTGSFTVGRTIRDWTDPVDADSLAPVPGTRRELLVWIWYPSATGQSAVADDYLPLELRPLPGTADRANIWTLLTREAANVRGHKSWSASTPRIGREGSYSRMAA